MGNLLDVVMGEEMKWSIKPTFSFLEVVMIVLAAAVSNNILTFVILIGAISLCMNHVTNKYYHEPLPRS